LPLPDILQVGLRMERRDKDTWTGVYQKGVQGNAREGFG